MMFCLHYILSLATIFRDILIAQSTNLQDGGKLSHPVSSYAKAHVSSLAHHYTFFYQSTPRQQNWASYPANRSFSLVYHATIILLCRPYRSKQPRARKIATAAAEMIDRLFMLHVRRFGFRVITYLESYTMFVASTINILNLKEGIDGEGASARIEFSLELFRNAASTPANLRCVEIIEQLLHRQDRSSPPNVENRAHLNSNTSSGQFVNHLGPTPVNHSSFTQSTYPTSTFSNPGQQAFSSTMGPDTNYQNSVIDAGNSYADSTMRWPQATVPSSVEQPLQWLPDNIGDNYSWMLTNMDFTKDFENHVP